MGGSGSDVLTDDTRTLLVRNPSTPMPSQGTATRADGLPHGRFMLVATQAWQAGETEREGKYGSLAWREGRLVSRTGRGDKRESR